MKKVIITLLALVLAIGLVACGSAEDKFAKESAPVMKAYVDGSKAVIDQYKAVKTADDFKAADEAVNKLKSEMSTKMGEIMKKYEGKLDSKKMDSNTTASNSAHEMLEADKAIMEARKAAEEAVAKAKKDEKKK